MRIVRTCLPALLGAAWLAGCTTATPVAPTSVPTMPPADTPVPQPSATSEPVPTQAPALSFEPATYRDDVAGFALDYPAHWTVGPTEPYSRGGITAFTSWTRPANVLPDAAPPGETRMDATVQLWDPKGDLEAFLGQRQGAWDASGIAVLDEERGTLEDGRPTAAFVVEGSDGAEAFFFFTTVGEDYLALSGSGDLTLLAEIAGTVRLIPAT